MDSSSQKRLVDELQRCITKTVAVVRALTDTASCWDTPLASSEAGLEMAAEESAHVLGSWPWLVAPMVSRWALQIAAEEAEGLSVVICQGAIPFASAVLCRAVLEHTSLAWWLLEPNIGAQRRAVRAMAYRLRTAQYTAKAVSYLELDPSELRSDYGELPDQVTRELGGLGTDWTCSESSRWVSHGGVKETCPSYTDRVGSLVGALWAEPRLPYAMLSAVAHGELLGLMRGLPSPRLNSDVPPVADPGGVWFWHDAALAVGALTFSTSRAARFLGIRKQLKQAQDWVSELADFLKSSGPTWAPNRLGLRHPESPS
jgi:hypothetical protein